MNTPKELKYSKDHEWISVNGNIGTVGITDYAQGQLGDVVFVEVETVGKTLKAGAAFGTIEAVKTVSDSYMPVDGKVLEFNKEIETTPEIVNSDPYGKGWLVKIEIANPSQLNDLLTADGYAAMIGA